MASTPTQRLEIPLRGGRSNETEVLVAYLWSAGALGVWEQPDMVVAWFTQRLERLDPRLQGGRWADEPDRDWQAEWKASIGPVRAGRTAVVPTWLIEEHRPGPGELTLALDPGRAFGSGHHATTLMCLEALDELDLDGGLAGRRVADVGCGSGVLAIAAAARGAHVQAVDIDPAAVDVTRENAERNGVHLDVHQGSVDSLNRPVDVVVANLITDVVADLATDLVAATTDRLIVSGITTARADVALTPLREAGVHLEELRDRDGWVVVIARRLGAPATS